MRYQIEFLTDKSHHYRSICFLISDLKKNNGKAEFDKLSYNDERSLRTRFDNWVSGFDNSKHYHGWNKTEFKGKYKNCFVFKKNPHRLYGFLCNPKISNPGYQLCVIVRYAKKNQNATDVTELKMVEDIRKLEKVINCINSNYK